MPCCLIEGDEVALVVSIHAISSSSFYKRCADRSLILLIQLRILQHSHAKFIKKQNQKMIISGIGMITTAYLFLISSDLTGSQLKQQNQANGRYQKKIKIL